MTVVSLIGYGDLGSQTGRDMSKLASGLHKRCLLDQLYCRGIENSNISERFVTESILFGRSLPRLLTGINRYTANWFDHRYYSERLFDISTARVVKDSDIHLHHTPGYINTLQRGNYLDNKTVVKATTEYTPLFNNRVAKERKQVDCKPSFSNSCTRRCNNRKRTLQECDQILAISSFVKRSLIEAGFRAEKIAVTPLGVKFEDYPLTDGTEDGGFTTLYIGSVSVAKGIHHLLKAWQLNGWGNNNSVRLVLCGQVSPTIRDLLAEYDFSNVKTPGFVDPRDYHQDASVFVFPSISDGFGKAPLEAMAAGLPVLTTENTGLPDIITDGCEGFIIPAGDPKSLADRLDRLRERPDTRNKMGEQALKTAREQTWEKHVDTVVTAIGLTEQSK